MTPADRLLRRLVSGDPKPCLLIGADGRIELGNSAAAALLEIEGGLAGTPFALFLAEISAHEALDIGLLNYVVPVGELDAKTDWLLARIADKSPTAIRRGKYALRRMESMHADEALAFMEAQIGILSLTEDAAEGRRAFNEKRPPHWTGR